MYETKKKAACFLSLFYRDGRSQIDCLDGDDDVYDYDVLIVKRDAIFVWYVGWLLEWMDAYLMYLYSKENGKN